MADKLIKEHLAVVCHWPAGSHTASMKGVKRWMEQNTPGYMYHRFFKEDQFLYGKNTNYQCKHCGANNYTEKATEFFGAYCPPWDHREKPHRFSPNMCTVGVCIFHDYPDGSYKDITLENASKHIAGILSYYSLDIDALWRHSDIVGSDYKKCPKYFVENESAWLDFKSLVNSKLKGY